MQLRVRSSREQSTIGDLTPSSTIEELQTRLAGLTGVPFARQEILSGFPPKPLSLPADRAEPLASLGIRSGDTLTVREAATEPAAVQVGAESLYAAAASELDLDEDEALARAIAASLEDQERGDAGAGMGAGMGAGTGARMGAGMGAGMGAASDPGPLRAAPSAPSARSASVPGPAEDLKLSSAVQDEQGGWVVRRVVPSDNSCLFNAVGLVAGRGQVAARELRALVASAVLGDGGEGKAGAPHAPTWDEATLGRPPAAYAAWILEDTHWGGAIELAVLAEALCVELAAFDIQTRRCDIYGRGRGFARRGMLLYDGLHYDALTVNFEGLAGREGGDLVSVEAADDGGGDEGQKQALTLLQPAARRLEAVMQAARRLVHAAHEAKAFTNVANFSLRCSVCYQGLRGEAEAMAHAKATGHSNFVEYS